MNLTKLSDFEILDCTIRDGGYINNWRFDKKLTREVYRALSKAGVDYIEIGYRGTEEYFNKTEYGIWRFTPEEVIREVIHNIHGAKIALMADYGKIDAKDFCEAKDSVINLVRVAVHKDNLQGAIELLEEIRQKGYKTSLNAMDYSSYSKNESSNLINLLKKTNVDYIYIVDSYGSLLPYQFESIFKPFLDIPNIKIGFHSHNSLQMAFANTLEAVSCGVHIIDSTIYGMGRAAGNLPTEIIISFLERERKDKYNSMPILNIIDRYFVSLQNENKWGYQLPYMLSGMFQCHPNYAKTLVDAREYTIEDIWKTMDYVKSKKTIGFSKSILRDLIADGIITGSRETQGIENETAGSNKAISEPKSGDAAVPYVNRHLDRDFLILANGPSLKEYKGKIDKFIAKYDPVILGANYLGDLFKPHYHAFNNKRRFAAYIDTVMPESKLLIGQYIPNEMISEYTDSGYEKLYYTDVLKSDFDIRSGVITTNCRTIAILLLGVAIVMGAKRVFAVGMDGYADKGSKRQIHFYNEKDEKEDQEMILERHHWCQHFIEQIDSYLVKSGKEGVHIITPTSYRLFYKGIENYV